MRSTGEVRVGKGKEISTEAVTNIFEFEATDEMEEGEYIPEYVDSVPMNDEDIEEAENSEFVDEFAYDVDCLGIQVDVTMSREAQLVEKANRERRQAVRA